MPAGRTLRRYTNDEDGDSSAGPSQHASSTPSRPPAPSSSDQSSLQQRPPPSTPPLSSSDFQDIPRSEDCSRRQVHLSLMQPISYPEGTYGQYSPGMSAKLPRWVKPGSKWQLCEEDLPTEELFQWFEIQHNDYGVKDAKIWRGVNIKWTGHGGSASGDWRARPFSFRWAKGNDAISYLERQDLIKTTYPVARAWFSCHGRHDAVGKADIKNPSPNDPPSVSRWLSCKGHAEKGANVRVLVEVYADDLTRCNVYMDGKHKDTEDKTQLKMSRRIHALIEEKFAEHGGTHAAKVTQVQLWLMHYPLQAGRRADYTLPEFRIPTEKGIRSMQPASKRRLQLDRHPMIAIHLLTVKLPDRIFYYTPYDSRVPSHESQFSCAMKDNFTMDCSIMNAPDRGLAVDSSHRNKNENRAPVTLVTTVDESGHMVPAAAMISAKINEETLENFLRGMTVEVYKRACDIVENIERDPTMSVYGARPEERAALLARARKIVQEGFNPSHWMTDKCFAQIRAILRVFPDAVIRLCQFHLIQAFLRWDTDPGVKKTASPKIPLTMKFRFLVAIRLFQRVRTYDELKYFKELLMTRLRRIVYGLPVDFEIDPSVLADLEKTSQEASQADAATSDTPDGDVPESAFDYDTWYRPDVEADKEDQAKAEPQTEDTEGEDDPAKWSDFDPEYPDFQPKPKALEQWLFVKCYILKNWLRDWMIHMWTDIGLPPEGTRDGTWNVNNWIERAFRVIDQVFLDCRKNKRIDRLAIVILLEFFPFYAYWRARGEKAPPVKLHSANWVGYTIWERSNVELIRDRVYRVFTQAKVDMVDPDTPAPPPQSDLEVDVEYVIDLAKCRCSCVVHAMTGKACGHIQAARLFEELGPVDRFKEAEAAGAKFKQSRTGGKLRTDAACQAELEKVMKLLEDKAFSVRQPPKAPLPPGLQALEKGRKPILFENDTVRRERDVAAPNDLITPLQPYRRTADRALPHTPVFQLPPGRPAAVNMHNSCLPASAKTFAINPAANLLPKEVILVAPPRLPAPAPSPFPRPVSISTKSSIRKEEALIFSTNCTRWIDEDCSISIDEVDLFMESMNSCSAKLGRRVVFLDSITATQARDVLASLDWSAKPGDDHEEAGLLRGIGDEGQRKAAQESLVCQLLWAHRQQPLVRIVFLNLSEGHWTFVVHDLTAPLEDSVQAFNSLDHRLDYDIRDQISFQQFFRNDRPSRPELSAPYTSYRTTVIPVQQQEPSSGFWTIFYCWAVLLGIPLDNVAYMTTSLGEVKRKLREVYVGYVSNPIGLSRRVVEAAFGLYVDIPHAPGQPGSAMLVVAPAPPDRPEDSELAEFRRYRKYLEFGTQVLSASGPCQVDGKKISQDVLRACTHAGEPLCPDLFDVAVRLTLSGTATLDGAEAWCQGKTIVLTTRRAAAISAANVQEHDLCRPTGRLTWFERNIFSDGGYRILIPFHKARKGAPADWDVVEIDIAKQEITIFSPRDSDKNTRWKPLMRRLVKLLRFEYDARGRPMSLGAIWSLIELPRPADAKRAVQTLTPEDDGFYALEFLKMLTAGVQPWPENWNTAGFASKTIRTRPLVLVGLRTQPALAQQHGIDAQDPFAWSQPTGEDGLSEQPSAGPAPPPTLRDNIVTNLRNPQARLYDYCIHAWLQYLVRSGDPEKTWHIVDSSFFTRLQVPSLFNATSCWNKAVKMTSLHRVMAPIHWLQRQHWTLACINFREKRIEHYDSTAPDADDNARLFQTLMQFVKRRLVFEDDRCVPEVEVSRWSESLYCLEDVPQQGNDRDCGVYVCAFMEAIAHGKTPATSSGFTFDKNDAAAYRTRMLKVLGPTSTSGSIPELVVAAEGNSAGGTSSPPEAGGIAAGGLRLDAQPAAPKPVVVKRLTLKLGPSQESTTSAALKAQEPLAGVNGGVTTPVAVEVSKTAEALPNAQLPLAAVSALALPATPQAATPLVDAPLHSLLKPDPPSTLPLPSPQPPLPKPIPFPSSAPPANGPSSTSIASLLMAEPEEDFDGAGFLQWFSRSTKSKRPALQVTPGSTPNGAASSVPVPPAPIPRIAAEDRDLRRRASDEAPPPSVDAPGSSLPAPGPSKAGGMQTGGAPANATATSGASFPELPRPPLALAKPSPSPPKIPASSTISASVPSLNQLAGHTIPLQVPLPVPHPVHNQRPELETQISKDALPSIARQEPPPSLTRFELLALKPNRLRVPAPPSDVVAPPAPPAEPPAAPTEPPAAATQPPAAPTMETSATATLQGSSRPKRDRDLGEAPIPDASSQKGASGVAKETARRSVVEDEEAQRKRPRLSEHETPAVQTPTPNVPSAPIVNVKLRLRPSPATPQPPPIPKADGSPPLPTPPARSASVPAPAPSTAAPPASLATSAIQRPPKRRRGSEDAPSEMGSTVSQQTTVAPAASASSPPEAAGTSSPPTTPGAADPTPSVPEAPPEAGDDTSRKTKRVRGVFTERAGQSLDGGRWSFKRK